MQADAETDGDGGSDDDKKENAAAQGEDPKPKQPKSKPKPKPRVPSVEELQRTLEALEAAQRRVQVHNNTPAQHIVSLRSNMPNTSR